MSTSRRRKDDRTIRAIRAIARQCGYAVGVHGARSEKDLDLIACPWTPAATSAVELIDRLCAGVPLWNGCIRDTRPNKPHGRVAHLLLRPPMSGQGPHMRRIIDLSIMPLANPQPERTEF